MTSLDKYLGQDRALPQLVFLISWCFASILVVSFVRVHALDETVFVFSTAAVITHLFVRLLPARRLAWAVILCGGIAVLISVYVDVSAVLANSYQVSLGIGVGVFLVLLVLSRRPAFSLCLCAVIVGGLVGISHTKYAYTGVPLLWLDLHLAASTWQFLLDMQSVGELLIQLVALAFVIGLWRMDQPVAYSHRRKTWAVTLVGGLRACAEFCVNGLLAGNCRLVRSHNEHKETRRP